MNRLFVTAPYVCTVSAFLVFAIAGSAPLGHDFHFELVRLAAYAHAWQDGQLPPYWGGDLYAGYGSPIFLFYGHVYLAVAAAISALTHGYALGSVLALACITAFGVWAMVRAGSQLLPSDTAAATGRVAAYVYLLNPYVLGDALLRNANAEYTALCALPLVVSGVLLSADGARAGVLWLTAGLALVLSAHLLSAGLTSALLAFLVVCLLRAASSPRLFCARVGIGFGLALLLSGFLWLPVLLYGPSIRTEDLLTGKFEFRQNFVPWGELFDSNTFRGPGLSPLLALGAAVILGVRERKRLSRRTWSLLFAFGTAVVVLLVFQTSASAPLWELLVVPKYLQFPWRLTGPLALSSALLAAIVVGHVMQRASPRWRWISEALVLGMCLIGALSTFRQLRVLDHAEIAMFEQSLRLGTLSAHPQSATVGNEYLPRVVRPDLALVAASQRPALFNHPETRVKALVDEPRHLVVNVEATQAQAICLARWGFEFWQLQIDGKPVAQIPTKLGCLGVRVPAGTHRIEARLTTPLARGAGLGLSALGLCIVAWWFRRGLAASRRVAHVQADATRSG